MRMRSGAIAGMVSLATLIALGSPAASADVASADVTGPVPARPESIGAPVTPGAADTPTSWDVPVRLLVPTLGPDKAATASQQSHAESAPAPAAAAQALPSTLAKPRRGVVYLTFDDGPRPDATPAILAILARNQAKATFFVMGVRAAKYPAIVDAIRAQGNAIGNHTWSHPELTGQSNAAIRTEIRRTQAVIGAATCFRAPYGSTSPRVERVIKGAGLRHYLWTVDTSDWMRPSTKAIVSSVMRGLRPGAIVLMHDGGGDRSHTVAAVRTLIPAIQAAGFELRALPGCAG